MVPVGHISCRRSRSWARIADDTGADEVEHHETISWPLTHLGQPLENSRHVQHLAISRNDRRYRGFHGEKIGLEHGNISSTSHTQCESLSESQRRFEQSWHFTAALTQSPFVYTSSLPTGPPSPSRRLRARTSRALNRNRTPIPPSFPSGRKTAPHSSR